MNAKKTGVPQLTDFANYVETLLSYSSASEYQQQLQGFELDTSGALKSALTALVIGAGAAATVDNKINTGL